MRLLFLLAHWLVKFDSTVGGEGQTEIIQDGDGINLTFDINPGSETNLRLDGDPGIAGQVLTSNGSDAAPTWEDSTGGGASGLSSGMLIAYGSPTNLSANVQNLSGGQGTPSAWRTPYPTTSRINISASIDENDSTGITLNAADFQIDHAARYNIDIDIQYSQSAPDVVVSQLVKNGTIVLAHAHEEGADGVNNANSQHNIIWQGDVLSTDTFELYINNNGAPGGSTTSVKSYSIRVTPIG